MWNGREQETYLWTGDKSLEVCMYSAELMGNWWVFASWLWIQRMYLADGWWGYLFQWMNLFNVLVESIMKVYKTHHSIKAFSEVAMLQGHKKVSADCLVLSGQNKTTHTQTHTYLHTCFHVSWLTNSLTRYWLTLVYRRKRLLEVLHCGAEPQETCSWSEPFDKTATTLYIPYKHTHTHRGARASANRMQEKYNDKLAHRKELW